MFGKAYLKMTYKVNAARTNTIKTNNTPITIKIYSSILKKLNKKRSSVELPLCGMDGNVIIYELIIKKI